MVLHEPFASPCSFPALGEVKPVVGLQPLATGPMTRSLFTVMSSKIDNQLGEAGNMFGVKKHYLRFQ